MRCLAWGQEGRRNTCGRSAPDRYQVWIFVDLNIFTSDAKSMGVSAYSVLLVEDDASFARFIIGSFRDVEPKIDLFHVNSGHAALSVIGSGFRPDLIMCEDRMPRMSGGELLASVRADPSCQSVPFFMFTSSFTDDVPATPGRQPLEAKLPRPATYREALLLINRVLASVAQEAHSAEEAEAVAI